MPIGVATVLCGVFLVLIGIVFVHTREGRSAPQRVPEPPGPLEVTDVIAGLPLLYGRPVRHRYDPDGFEHPLSCFTCEQPILPQAEFWEIPILNDEWPEAMIAICLQCDSRSPYDKLEA